MDGKVITQISKSIFLLFIYLFIFVFEFRRWLQQRNSGIINESKQMQALFNQNGLRSSTNPAAQERNVVPSASQVNMPVGSPLSNSGEREKDGNHIKSNPIKYKLQTIVCCFKIL